jgi:hypothetical protein
MFLTFEKQHSANRCGINKIKHRLHACMHTAWQHTWRLYDATATPHTAQAAGGKPLRRTQQCSFTPWPMAEQKESCIRLI